MTFDYELCRERDGGKAMYDGEVVLVIGEPNRAGVTTKWYPVKEDNGIYSCIPDFELRNLDPPKPELEPVDVVWWINGSDSYACVFSPGEAVTYALRRITVDPNVLTADELAEHGLMVTCCGPKWLVRTTKGHDVRGLHDRLPTHAEACRAATEWLREQGKVK